MNTKTRVIEGASTRQKFAGGFLAVAMAFSMAVSAPALAFAAEGSDDAAITDVAETDYIDILTDPIHVKANSQTSLLGTAENPNFSYTDGDHLEFKVLSGDAGTVNRRGMFSSLASGTATVGVYLHEGTEPTPGPGTDPAVDALVTETVSVVVDAETPTPTYTFQGKDQAILMTNPTVQSTTGSDATGYVNQLGKVSNDEGDISFYITMQAGYGNNFATWLSSNAANIQLTTSKSSRPINANNANLNVTADPSGSRTEIVVTVKALDLGLAVGDTGTLTFTSNFSGNNTSRTLGTSVAFNFTV